MMVPPTTIINMKRLTRKPAVAIAWLLFFRAFIPKIIPTTVQGTAAHGRAMIKLTMASPAHTRESIAEPFEGLVFLLSLI